ncbi:MAG: phenylacetate--CoA ligase family protein [Lautropia sp.]
MSGTIGDFARLRAAIERAWRLSAFYRRHWLSHGVTENWIPPDPDALSALPVVTKEDLLEAQRRDKPWGGNLCIGETDIAQVHLTTGTSGIGQERYALSAADVDVMGRSWGPQYAAIGLQRGDVACMTIPVSFFCAGLSALEGARIHGLLPILTGVASKDLMLDLLTQHKVSYLYGVESLLLQLANLARERGLAGHWRGRLKGVQAVGTSPQMIAAARDVFGARLFEIYGCTQAAAKIASTCRLGVEQGANHFHDEHLFIETRDPDTGAGIDEGDAELIISTPYRQASPVIRFAIRDKVRLVPAGCCACGGRRPGFVPGSLGRIDAMLKVRGVNLWPQQVEQLLLGHPAVRDFRAEVLRMADGADELLLRVATISGAQAQCIEESIGAIVREKTMVRPRVVLDQTLPENLGLYKVRRWEDRRKAASADSI